MIMVCPSKELTLDNFVNNGIKYFHGNKDFKLLGKSTDTNNSIMTNPAKNINQTRETIYEKTKMIENPILGTYLIWANYKINTILYTNKTAKYTNHLATTKTILILKIVQELGLVN